jgi:hypothetical protein
MEATQLPAKLLAPDDAWLGIGLAAEQAACLLISQAVLPQNLDPL